MTYETHDLKKPIESDDYQECSNFIVTSIESIMKDAMDTGRNRIEINTNLLTFLKVKPYTLYN